MVFIEAPAFTRHLASYLADEEYRQPERALLANPEAGVVMPQTGGFRKLTWSDPRRAKGARGGLRIISFYFPADAQIWLLTLYGKDEVEDLTPAEKRALETAIDAERQARAARRSQGRKTKG